MEGLRPIYEQQLSAIESEATALEEMIDAHAKGDPICVILHHVNNGTNTQPIALDREDVLDVIARLQVNVDNRKQAITAQLNALED